MQGAAAAAASAALLCSEVASVKHANVALLTAGVPAALPLLIPRGVLCDELSWLCAGVWRDCTAGAGQVRQQRQDTILGLPRGFISPFIVSQLHCTCDQLRHLLVRLLDVVHASLLAPCRLGLETSYAPMPMDASGGLGSQCSLN